MTKTVYLVLRADGNLKTRGRSAAGSAYTSKAEAQRRATSSGDAVVAVEIDMTSEPLFIRRKVLDGDT